MSFLRKYATGAGADLYLPIVKRAVVDFAVGADWTPAAGDVTISIDGGAAANIGTLPTALTMGNGAVWKFVFTNAELTGKYIAVTVVDSATKAVEDQSFMIETYGNASALHPFDLGSASTPQTGDSFARLGAPAAASVSADILAIDNFVDDLEARLGTPSDLGSGATVAANLADIEAQTDDIGVAGAGLTALGDTRIANLDATVSSRATPAQVNTEVVDALATDTYAEPGQGAPAATASLVVKIGHLFKALRNKKTQTATERKIYADDGTTVDAKATDSDDGTTYTKGELISGP
jgi:hypothetical protein